MEPLSDNKTETKKLVFSPSFLRLSGVIWEATCVSLLSPVSVDPPIKLQSQRPLDANHCILDVKYTDFSDGKKCVAKFAGEVKLQAAKSHRF